MADRTVVVLRWRMSEPQQSNYILVPVVRELDRELLPGRRITKRVSHIIARRCLRMANGADRRPCTAEELRSMTAHTRVVAWIVGDIREPYLVAAITGRLVFACGMGKFRVVNR